MAHTSLMQRLLFLTKTAQQSNKKNIPAEEFAEESFYNRRHFLEISAKATVAATVLAGCSKTVDNSNPRNGGNGNENTNPKIVIVGAGIAGLTAAFHLRNGGVDADLYDAGKRAGGRMFTAQNVLNNGLSTELGGEFIDSDHADIRMLANHFGFELLDLYSPQELQLKQNLYFINGVNYSDNDFMDAIKHYLPRINKDINSLSDIIKYDSFSPTDKHFDNMNLEQYFDSINLTGWLRSLLLVAYVGEYGLDQDKCNAINFLYLFGKSPEGQYALYGKSDERYRVKGGNQQIVDALAHQFKNRLYLQHKLLKISTAGNAYELFFDGETASVKADIVILTLPFTLLRDVEINVEMPAVKRKAIDTLTYGFNSKLVLGFNGRPWRKKFNSVGMTYTDNGAQNCWDNSQLQQNSNGGLTVFLGGSDAVTLAEGSDAFQADKYLKKITQFFPGIDADYGNKARRMIWPHYSLTKGSYSAWSVGQYTTIAGSEGEQVGNIYFAGEHTSYNFQGYMNGGAASGRGVAKKILKAINK